MENVLVEGFLSFQGCDLAFVKMKNLICNGMNFFKNEVRVGAIFDSIQVKDMWFWFYRNKMRSIKLIKSTFEVPARFQENQYTAFDDDLFIEDMQDRFMSGMFAVSDNVFKGTLGFWTNEFRSLICRGNEISERFKLYTNEIFDDVNISGCKFHDAVQVVGHRGNGFIFDSNELNHQSDSIGHLFYKIDLQSELTFFENRVRDSSGAIGFHFEKIQSRFFNVQGNAFLGPTIFYACFVNGRFVLSKNDFKKKVAFSSLKYDDQSFIEWKDLRQNLITIETYIFSSPVTIDSVQYNVDSDSAMEQTINFNRLLQIYSDLKNLYRVQGNLSDANELDVLIGDLRLKRFKYLYRKKPTLNSFFNWKMNAFMKEFSAYGTDPVISIIYSLRIILLFALFYLFFYNQWDRETRGSLGRRLKFLLNYFRSSEDLVIHYEKEVNVRNKKDRELAKAYEQSANKVPPFFLKLTEFYFNYLDLKPRSRSALLKRLEMMSGTWVSLPARRKYWVASTLSIWFSFYLMWFLASKVLNAIALSVNAFTTLGFGFIPTEGVSRYVLILEGFLGWVMMSIFSVTLISQLIS